MPIVRTRTSRAATATPAPAQLFQGLVFASSPPGPCLEIAAKSTGLNSIGATCCRRPGTGRDKIGIPLSAFRHPTLDPLHHQSLSFQNFHIRLAVSLNQRTCLSRRPVSQPAGRLKRSFSSRERAPHSLGANRSNFFGDCRVMARGRGMRMRMRMKMRKKKTKRPAENT